MVEVTFIIGSFSCSHGSCDDISVVAICHGDHDFREVADGLIRLESIVVEDEHLVGSVGGDGSESISGKMRDSSKRHCARIDFVVGVIATFYASVGNRHGGSSQE